MANCCSSSMGVPLCSSSNHLTASFSAIANYSRITLHSFNSAAGQALFCKTVVHQGLMGTWEFGGTAAVNRTRHLSVKKKPTEKKKTMKKWLLCPIRPRKPLDWTSRRLCRTCIEDRRRWNIFQTRIATGRRSDALHRRSVQRLSEMSPLKPKVWHLPFSLLCVSHRSSWKIRIFKQSSFV